MSRPVSEPVCKAMVVTLGTMRSTVTLAGEPEAVVVALPASSATLKVPATVNELEPLEAAPIVLVAGIEQVAVPLPVMLPNGVLMLPRVKSTPPVTLTVEQSRFSPAERLNERAVPLVGLLVTAARVKVGAVTSRVTVAAVAPEAGPLLAAVSVAPLAAKVRMIVPAEQLVRATV